MAAGDIESNRRGTWSEQAISRLNPDSNVNFVITGSINSNLVEGGISSVDLQSGEDSLYLVGLGLRKDTGYAETLLSCREVWVPFSGSAGIERVVLNVTSRTSYPDWVYVWTDTTSSLNEVKRYWLESSSIPLSDAYYTYGSGSFQELEYDIALQGPGGIIFIPYVHDNYLTSDNYNGVLGNVSEVADPDDLYSILRSDVDSENLKKFVSPNLRYKNYIWDYHKIDAVGGTHVGDLEIPGGDLSRCVEESEYFKSFENKAREQYGDITRLNLQTLDFPFMQYRAISASVYVDRFERPEETSSIELRKVWEDMQGGNVDDPETIYFISTASREECTGSLAGNYKIVLGEKTTIPVTGSVLFRMDGHLAVRFTEATIYAPFLNTVFRTGKFGEVLETFTSGSE